MSYFNIVGQPGRSVPNGTSLEMSPGQISIQVEWKRLNIACNQCYCFLAVNGCDDVAYARYRPGNKIRHCPECGSHFLELTAELENGQMIFRCQNCGKAPLAVNRNVVFVEKKS